MEWYNDVPADVTRAFTNKEDALKALDREYRNAKRMFGKDEIEI